MGRAVSGRHPDNTWSEFIPFPFLDSDLEIRRVLSTTNAIESLNARYRRAVRSRGHFPSQAAMKCLYLDTRPSRCSGGELRVPAGQRRRTRLAAS